MDKWKPLYGSNILANLAYIQAMRGNLTLSKQHLEEFDALYGNDLYDEDEDKKIAYVRFVLESELTQEK